MSTKDICDLLEACHKFGVAELTSGTLSFKFLPQRNVDAVNLGQGTDADVKIPSVSKELTNQVKLMDENAEDEVEEAQLMIDDPFSFERSQIDRHVERNRLNNGSNN